jgi:hypothetical protein
MKPERVCYELKKNMLEANSYKYKINTIVII